MKVLIVASGSIKNDRCLIERYKWADLVIAADGGAMHLLRAGLTPHIVLGDFDSVSSEDFKRIRELDPEIVEYPAKKDYTDMELAINIAVEKGAREIVLFGATGTRLDHTMANVFLLYGLLQKGIKGCIEDENNIIYLVDDSITIKKQENRKVSLLSLPPCANGLSTKGLLYPLKDFKLDFGVSLGVSNEFIEDTATITLKKGLLLVFVSKD